MCICWCVTKISALDSGVDLSVPWSETNQRQSKNCRSYKTPLGSSGLQKLHLPLYPDFKRLVPTLVVRGHALHVSHQEFFLSSNSFITIPVGCVTVGIGYTNPSDFSSLSMLCSVHTSTCRLITSPAYGFVSGKGHCKCGRLTHHRVQYSYLLTYLLTYLLHGAESFLRS